MNYYKPQSNFIFDNINKHTDIIVINKLKSC